MILKKTFLLWIALLMIGCQNNELNKLKANLRELEINLNDANKKIEDLKSLNDNLKKEIEEVTFKHENLLAKKIETDEWIVSLVKEVGPCVWIVSQFEKPVPHDIISSGTAKDLIAKLNIIFRSTNSPEATLLKVENGTAYIKIVEDDKLTQEMGTSGAISYINSIIYTMFSIRNIECIDLDFEEGDHAFPGIYCPGKDHKNANKST